MHALKIWRKQKHNIIWSNQPRFPSLLPTACSSTTQSGYYSRDLFAQQENPKFLCQSQWVISSLTSIAAPLLSSRKVSLLPKTSQESTVIPNSPANYYYIFRIMHNTDHYLHLLIFKTPHTISLDIVNSRTTGTLIISKISPPFNCASILYYLVLVSLKIMVGIFYRPQIFHWN